MWGLHVSDSKQIKCALRAGGFELATSWISCARITVQPLGHYTTRDRNLFAIIISLRVQLTCGQKMVLGGDAVARRSTKAGLQWDLVSGKTGEEAASHGEDDRGLSVVGGMLQWRRARVASEGAGEPRGSSPLLHTNKGEGA